MESVYVIAYSKKKNSLVSTIFPTRERAKQMLPIYRAKGWTGNILKVDAPKPLTKEEKEDLKQASLFLRKLTGR